MADVQMQTSEQEGKVAQQPLAHDEKLNAEWNRALKAGEEQWYTGAVDYWKKQDRSINGVLGGFQVLNAPDVEGSKAFIKNLKKIDPPMTWGTVVDCGAGMGRVTKQVLIDQFKIVDLVEPCDHLLEEAKLFIDNPRAERFLMLGLQDFYPEAQRYDCIWNQWCCLYLTDEHLVQYLKRCQAALRPGGLIIVKENVIMEGRHVFDMDDNSITRTDAHYRELAKLAGLTLVADMRQGDWPGDMFAVMMYAYR